MARPDPTGEAGAFPPTLWETTSPGLCRRHDTVNGGEERRDPGDLERKGHLEKTLG